MIEVIPMLDGQFVLQLMDGKYLNKSFHSVTIENALRFSSITDANNFKVKYMRHLMLNQRG